LAAPRRRTYARYLFTAQPTPRQIQADTRQESNAAR
jgi:hypothetical protein